MHESQDHIWQLQANYEYMHHYADRSSDTSFAKAHANNRGMETELASAIIALCDIHHDVWMARFWIWIDEILKAQRLISEQLNSSHGADQHLHAEFQEKLGVLEVLLSILIDSQSQYLRIIIASRPGFSHNWSLVMKGDQEQAIRTHYDYDDDPLEWGLMASTTGIKYDNGKSENTIVTHHSRVFQFIDRLISLSSKDSAS